jgi:hypothetical protein
MGEGLMSAFTYVGGWKKWLHVRCCVKKRIFIASVPEAVDEFGLEDPGPAEEIEDDGDKGVEGGHGGVDADQGEHVHANVERANDVDLGGGAKL